MELSMEELQALMELFSRTPMSLAESQWVVNTLNKLAPKPKPVDPEKP